MLMRYLFPALILLSACDIQWVPEPDNVEVVPPANADQARDIAVAEWADLLDVPSETISVPEIRWFSPDEQGCLRYDDFDQCLEGRTLFVSVFGAMGAEPEMHLLCSWEGCAAESALAHEILHLALRTRSARDGRADADADHHAPEWALERDVQGVMRDRLSR